MSHPDLAPDPWEIVARLRAWGEQTDWCDWIELGGSLGRGAGDRWSDIDAGVGVRVDDVPFTDRRDAVLAAIRGFGPVADDLIQHLGTPERPADHLIIQYADGRQLSLVVMPAPMRDGLPPQAVAVFDRTGRLARPVAPDRYQPSEADLREWSFLAWVSLGDADRHARRGHLWRAVRSLSEARALLWRLHATAIGVAYPGFGDISVESAGLPVPAGLEATLPASLTATAIRAGVQAMSPILAELTRPYDVDGLVRSVRARLDRP